MAIDDLTPQQKVVYNDMVVAFYSQYTPDQRLRLGQAFYNFYYGSVFKGSYPELFYCEDNHKAIEMITISLCEYVKQKVK